MNNDTFSIKRFGLLIRKDIQENWKKYLMHIATVYGALVIILTLSSSPNVTYENSVNRENINLLNFTLFIFFIMGLVFASTMMEPMNNKVKRISYLMNPSSVPEKFLSRWVIVTVFYIIIFLLVLVPADVTRVFICSIRYPGIEVPFMDFSKLVGESESWGEYSFPPKVFTVLIAVFFLLQSIFVLGSTFWQKNTLIKTFTVVLIITSIYLFVCYQLISILFFDGMEGFSDRLFSTTDNSENGPNIIISIIPALFALTNWILAFFRFKESEIIKRL